MRKTDVPVGKQ